MRIFGINDFKRAARRKLPRMIFDFIEGGALEEITVRLNEQRLEQRLLCQNILRDISNVSTSTSALGHSLTLPVMVAPMGALALLDKEGDLAVARATARTGSVFLHSGWSCNTLDDVVSAAPGCVWAQIAFWKDQQLFERHLAKIHELGVQTLVVSPDVAVSSKRYRNLKHGIFPPQRPPLKDLIDVAFHPGWLWGRLTGLKLQLANLPNVPRGTMLVRLDSDWKTLGELRKRWGGRIVLKGVMTPLDAEYAVQAGMDGIIVSNHGGRQFDGQSASIDVLDEVVHAVNDRMEVFLDGGITKGSDVAKALALGARAVFVGRAVAYALAVNGEEGVVAAIDMIKDELKTAMSFMGVTDVAAIDHHVLACESRRRRCLASRRLRMPGPIV